MDVVWYTTVYYITMDMGSITGISWLHGTGRVIGCLIATVQTLSASGNDSNGTITSYAYESLAVHSEYSNHIWMCNSVHGDMLSLSLKKDRSGKLSLKTGIIRIDHKMTIDTLLKHFYIAVWYFYITNRLISGDISRVIYKPTETMKSNYFTQALQGKLFHINKM